MLTRIREAELGDALADLLEEHTAREPKRTCREALAALAQRPEDDPAKRYAAVSMAFIGDDYQTIRGLIAALRSNALTASRA